MDGYIPAGGYRRVAVLAMYGGLGWLGFRFLLPMVWPFLIAFGAAVMLRPFAAAMMKRFRLPEAAAGAIALLIAAGGLCALLWFGAARGIRELSGVAEKTAQLIERAGELTAELLGRIGLDGGQAASLAKSAASALPSLLTGAVTALPGGLFAIAVTFAAAFCISTSYTRTTRLLLSFLPESGRRAVLRLKKRLCTFGAGYFRACLLLMLLTFAELLAGFLILRLDYAFTAALLCAIGDLLPIIGVGTILIPWACILLLDGRYYFGFGLLILWAVTCIVRQLVEPHIVGVSVGLDPLVTLLAVYLGGRTAGLCGIIAALIAAAVLWELRPDAASNTTSDTA